LTERSISVSERRDALVRAAIVVFARKGFHASRVGDIAEEAGVAHGLLYHYFSSKDELLETVFRETWTGLLEAVRDVEEGGGPAREQLRRVTAILLRSWLRDPDLVRVLVREIARSPELQRRIEPIGEALAAIERIVRAGQQSGELRDEVDPRLASLVLYGALESVLTGWVLGQLPDGENDVAEAERAIVEVVCGGLALAPSPVA
jgi:AcrR family transcriptional regulator